MSVMASIPERETICPLCGGAMDVAHTSIRRTDDGLTWSARLVCRDEKGCKGIKVYQTQEPFRGAI